MLLGVMLVVVLSKAECKLKREPPRIRGLPSIEELAAKGGYNVTNYEVITEDGYSLWLHRIGNKKGPPVLMQHGILVAADQWLTQGPKRDLAFILLDEGFDVWLSNQRGTFFNEYNEKYPKSDSRFWDFSFHESGYYDIPAVIDFILNSRQEKKLFYIGHSLGTTVFLVMTSMRPEYNEKIRAAVLLSPIAYPPAWNELSPSLQSILKNANFIYFSLALIGQDQVSQRNDISVFTLKELCAKIDFIEDICQDIILTYGGKHNNNLDEKEWDNFIPFFGAGTSLKTFHHLGQVYNSGVFKQYDYGLILNLKKYGKSKAPIYPLKKVSAPVALYWGQNDPVLSKSSVGKLESILPNILFCKPLPSFIHIDMYLGKNANIILFPDIIKLLKSH